MRVWISCLTIGLVWFELSSDPTGGPKGKGEGKAEDGRSKSIASNPNLMREQGAAIARPRFAHARLPSQVDLGMRSRQLTKWARISVSAASSLPA